MDVMFRFELTPSNAGIVFWGDTAAMDELHQFIHFAVDESPLIKIKDGFMLALAYDIRKAREGCRRTELYQYEEGDSYQLYGVELLWPLILLQSAILRRSMSYIQTDKKQLSIMYAFEHLLESALQEFLPGNRAEVMIKMASSAADSDFEWLEDNIDSRCCYFLSQPPVKRKEKLDKILCSFDSLWSQYAREKPDTKMLNTMNNTDWVWPDTINW